MAQYAHTDVLYISGITRLLCSELDLLLNILAGATGSAETTVNIDKVFLYMDNGVTSRYT